jgi:hypothetical protein
METVLPSHPESPAIQSLEVVVPPPATDRSPRHASGGNTTLDMSSLEVPQLQASMEAAPQDHPTLSIVLCPED